MGKKIDNREGFGKLDGLPDGLTICQAAVAVAAAGDEPKPMASEARPLKNHHVNVNVQTVQSWKCKMLTLSCVRFF